MIKYINKIYIHWDVIEHLQKNYKYGDIFTFYTKNYTYMITMFHIFKNKILS